MTRGIRVLTERMYWQRNRLPDGSDRDGGLGQVDGGFWGAGQASARKPNVSERTVTRHSLTESSPAVDGIAPTVCFEPGFPTDHQSSVLGQRLFMHVCAFRSGASENHKRSEGVLFVLNGQTRGSPDDRFFARKAVQSRLRQRLATRVGRLHRTGCRHPREHLHEQQGPPAADRVQV